jgi:cytochrome c2
MKPTYLLAVAAAMVTMVAAAPRSAFADSAAGEKVFKSRCANCHSLTPGLSTVAPDLTGVVGRKAGSLKDYQYSPALRNADFVFTREKMEQWLRTPHNVVPETEMTFSGLKSETERADVVEFLMQRTPKK